MRSSVAVVDAKGAFEVPRVPPGWYRLTIEPRPGESKADNGEFATRLIEVQDGDLDGLSLVLSPGASNLGTHRRGTRRQYSESLRATCQCVANSRAILAAQVDYGDRCRRWGISDDRVLGVLRIHRRR